MVAGRVGGVRGVGVLCLAPHIILAFYGGMTIIVRRTDVLRPVIIYCLWDLWKRQYVRNASAKSI